MLYSCTHIATVGVTGRNNVHVYDVAETETVGLNWTFQSDHCL